MSIPASGDTREHLSRLANFAATLSVNQIPSEGKRVIKRVLLDSLGCAFAADGLDPGCATVSSVFGRSGASGDSTLFSDGSRTSGPNAALINGALVHALNFDPIGTRSGHTGVACVAGPIALAEERDVSGEELLVCAAVAAEVSGRITCVVEEAGHRPSGKFLSGQLLSYFGAAAGCGRVIGLTGDKMESALCLALMQMSGSRQVIFGGDPPAKSIYGAFPAQGGVISALMAEAGLDARCDLFGAPAGLYPAIYGAEFDCSAISRDLFKGYRFMDTEFKPWPASNHVVPFIDAALRIASEIDDPASIEEIALFGNESSAPWLQPLGQKLAPQNLAAAANSAPYCVSAALATGRFDVAFAAAPERSPHIGALTGKFRVHLSSAQGGARLVVRLQSGDTKDVLIETPLGHPGNPLSDAQHLRKFAQCSSLSRNHAIRERHAEIADAILDLENVGRVRDITRMFRESQ